MSESSCSMINTSATVWTNRLVHSLQHAGVLRHGLIHACQPMPGCQRRKHGRLQPPCKSRPARSSLLAACLCSDISLGACGVLHVPAASLTFMFSSIEVPCHRHASLLDAGRCDMEEPTVVKLTQRFSMVVHPELDRSSP